MSSSAGYIVRLTPERQAVFEDKLKGLFFVATPFARVEEDYFAEPVPEFKHSRNHPLVCFVVDSQDRLAYVAKGQRGFAAGTQLRRLNLKSIVSLEAPLALQDIIDGVPARVRKGVQDRLSAGGLLRSKSLDGLIEAIAALSPDLGAQLERYSQARQERIGELSSNIREALAEQKEAVATALNIAGIDREALRDWDVDPNFPPSSFLDGLQQVRQREDPMIVNDLFTFPGHTLVRQTPHVSTVFRSDDTVLTVILANRQPLETVLGTDLIYYNETYACFLLVQYKAMEEREDSEAVFRLPDEQLDREIERMEATWGELAKLSERVEMDGFRLFQNPFFLKLCPRLRFNPDDTGLTPGMYLPLDYWKLLVADSKTIGPKGGRAVSYKNARRHFDNTEFAMLTSKAWIGTTTAQSKVLERVIQECLSSGRAVAIAVQSGPGRGSRR